MTTTPSTDVRQPGAIVPYEDMGFEWSDFGLDDIPVIFPITTIVQGTSRMPGADKHGGDFYNTGTETFASQIDVVILARSNTRALFEDGADQPLCRSADGKTPLPNQPLWARESFKARGGKKVAVLSTVQPGSCFGCPFSEWPEDGSAPLCQESDVYLIDTEEGELSQLRVKGKSLRPLRQWIGRRCLPKRIAPFNFRVRLGTDRKEGPSGPYQELVVKGAEQLPPAEAAKYGNLLAEQRARFEKTLRDSEHVEWVDETENGTTWGDGSESYAGERLRTDVDEDGVYTGKKRAPTPGVRDRLADKVGPMFHE